MIFPNPCSTSELIAARKKQESHETTDAYRVLGPLCLFLFFACSVSFFVSFSVWGYEALSTVLTASLTALSVVTASVLNVKIRVENLTTKMEFVEVAKDYKKASITFLILSVFSLANQTGLMVLPIAIIGIGFFATWLWAKSKC